jgi:ABC-type transporter Mla maintaining outer membrane lipid asymmetry ATPase subunit MlaF
MTDEKALHDAIVVAEDVVFWIRRYLQTPEPEILQVLLSTIEEFEDAKP